MNTGCETRIPEEFGDLTGATHSGEANSAPDRAQESARKKRARLEQELRPASMFMVHARLAGRKNHTAGASHWNARHTDDVVDHVLALHSAGMAAREIARGLGIARSTVRSWLTGRRRNPPMRRSNTRRPIDFELPKLIGLADLPSADSQSSTE